MPRTSEAFCWTKQTQAFCDAWAPLNLVLAAAKQSSASAERRAQALHGRRRASASVQWADAVAQDAWRGAHHSLRWGLAAAAVPAAISPRVRASYWACAVPVALFGAGTTEWARGTVLTQSRLGRAWVGLVGYGMLGAAVGAFRGARAGHSGPKGARASDGEAGATGAATAGGGPRPRRSLALAALDAALAGLVVLLHVAQGVACVYPTLFVAAAALVAGVLGLVAGGLFGGLRGLFAEPRRPDAPAHTAGAGGPSGPRAAGGNVGNGDTHRPTGSGTAAGGSPDLAGGAGSRHAAASSAASAGAARPDTPPEAAEQPPRSREAPPTDNVLANGASAADRVGAASPEPAHAVADAAASADETGSDHGSSGASEASAAQGSDFFDATDLLAPFDEATAPPARVESDSEDEPAPRRVA